MQVFSGLYFKVGFYDNHYNFINMIKHTLWLSLAALCLMSARCERPQQVEPGDTFVLAPGQSVACKSCELGFTFAAVTEDSRCPKYTNCVWEGQASVQFQLKGAAMEETLTITARGSQVDKASASRAGYRLQLLALDPYPESGKKIAPEDYRLKMTLVKE